MKLLEKLPKVEIDQNKFYTIGVYAFGINALMGTVSLSVSFQNLFWYDQISRVASLFFNFALFGFFVFLKRNFTTPKLKDIIPDEKLEEELLK